MAEYSQTYWNRLIDKYRNGSISDDERYQLEKQALDDPFLFDALEGYSLYEKRSKENKKGKTLTRIFTLPRIAVAASIVFLVAVMFNMHSNKKSPESGEDAFAMVMEPEEEKAVTIEETKDKTDAEIATTSTIENNKQISNGVKDNPIPNAAANSKRNEKRKKLKKEKVEEKMPVATKSTDVDNDKEEEVVISGNGINKGKALFIDGVAAIPLKSSNESEPIDQDVQEIISVSNAKRLEGDVGTLELQNLPEGKELKLGEMDYNNVQGREGVSIYYEAVPVIGKKIFDEFAKESIDERGLRQEKPQKVTIEFTIDKNGNLTDFHHIFSGCPECGPFAIALLQKSGEWKTVPPGLSGKARYTFIF